MSGRNGVELAEAAVVRPAPNGVTYVLAPAADTEADLSLSALVEALLFVADAPVAVTDLARALGAERRAVEVALTALEAACAGRGLRLQRKGSAVQLVTAPEAAEAIGRFLGLEASSHLSRAALEVLSVIAYRQPVTRPEIEDLRGVNSDAALRTLLHRGLVEPVGRRETVGHPVDYGTTFRFLEYFGLSCLSELPAAGAPSDGAVDATEPDVVPAADDAPAVNDGAEVLEPAYD